MMNKSINKDEISRQTRINRKKAIDVILFGGKTENKAVSNIIDTAKEQELEISVLANKLSENSLTLGAIYESLKSYKKGIIPVLIALLIKNNIKYMVVHNQLEEITIDSDLLDKDPDEISSISLRIIDNTEVYDKYKGIFYFDNRNKNIFSSIVDGMYTWFFNLDNYTINTSNEYIGMGKYKLLSQKIIDFKESLREIQKNPYWYLSDKLPNIIGQNNIEELKDIKISISNSLLNLKRSLLKDINSVFPETLKIWYENLSNISRKKIYKNGEEKFFKICLNECSEDELVEEIAKFLTGLSIKHWDDSVPEIFYNRLLNLRNVIEGREAKDINSGFIIKYINDEKEVFEKFVSIALDLDTNKEDMIIKEIKSIFNDYKNCISHSSKVAIALKLALEDDN